MNEQRFYFEEKNDKALLTTPINCIDTTHNILFRLYLTNSNATASNLCAQIEKATKAKAFTAVILPPTGGLPLCVYIIDDYSGMVNKLSRLDFNKFVSDLLNDGFRTKAVNALILFGL